MANGTTIKQSSADLGGKLFWFQPDMCPLSVTWQVLASQAVKAVCTEHLLTNTCCMLHAPMRV